MFTDTSLGSDESLGGALLTPIPWLNNSTTTEEDEGASGPADVNTAEAAQVSSQGSDAMDEDQHTEGNQEGSAAPGQPAQNHQHQQVPNPASGGPPANAEESEEIPHARGPPVLGVEDLGLQDGKGVEMVLDTKTGNSAAATSGPSNTGNEKRDQDMIADADGDIEIRDAQEKEPTQISDQNKDESGGPGTGGS